MVAAAVIVAVVTAVRWHRRRWVLAVVIVGGVGLSGRHRRLWLLTGLGHDVRTEGRHLLGGVGAGDAVPFGLGPRGLDGGDLVAGGVGRWTVVDSGELVSW